MIGACRFDGSWASGTVPAPAPFLGVHWYAPAGLFVELPLIAEQVFEVVVAPLHRGGGPCALQAAGDRVGAVAAAEGVLPAEALLLDGGALGFGADIFAGIGSAVGFAEGVPAGNERNGLLVIHRHAGERLPDIPCRGEWIRLSIGPFRIHVNQAHLNGGERIVELTIAAVALVPQPLALRPPENVLLRAPRRPRARRRNRRS